MARVLVIEDERDSRDLVRYALEIAGHEVVEATTAERGIELARSTHPDVILMDLSLPGEIDGLRATRALRAEPPFDQTPIVAVTAQSMHVDRARALEAGCDEFFAKPITDLAGFTAAIDRLTSRR